MAKTVFITGASSGIGRALALELAGRGYDLFLTARRLDALEQVRTDIAAAHPSRRVEVRRLDVTDDADVARAIAEAAERLGRCDIVVANAGVGNSGRVGEGNMERARLIVETNLIGGIATVDAAVALFRRQGGGQVVGVGSVAGVRGLPGSGSYSASKAGLATYLESVRAETHREPITVTTIAPGYIDTPINQDMKSRPFLIDVEKGARIAADLIERGVATRRSRASRGRSSRRCCGCCRPPGSCGARRSDSQGVLALAAILPASHSRRLRITSALALLKLVGA